MSKELGLTSSVNKYPFPLVSISHQLCTHGPISFKVSPKPTFKNIHISTLKSQRLARSSISLVVSNFHLTSTTRSHFFPISYWHHLQIIVIATNARRSSNPCPRLAIRTIINMHPHNPQRTRIIIKHMRSLHHSIRSQISWRLQREKFVHESPANEILQSTTPSSAVWIWKGGRERETYGTRITIDGLESTSIEFILPNLVVNAVRFYDTAAVGLHVLVQSCCCPCCSWDLRAALE